ncbi:MAG: tol-pal system protein YbgF [Lysobacterales bacterium RIFOXYA1_FULL_69_10]|nr:MAG: tol-pal system protein YbgF [Xanthomonadales bacterium RIFOXYA1_FULL_69_10]
MTRTRRIALVSATVAAALVAAAPAWAQRASLADRVALLEQRAADNQANVQLLNQVNLLKSEVTTLRSQVEELQHTLDQLRQTSRSQYLDLDGRINRLEGGVPASPPIDAAPVLDASPDAGGASVSEMPVADAESSPAVPAEDRPPSVYGDRGTLAQGEGEREAYDAAFEALKAGQYAESARLFQAFLGRYPGGSYAPNALYWLGESYYVTQNYPLAQEQFQALLDRYPTHDKAPGALLKVGLSQYGLQDLDGAERTLQDVVSRYPGSDAARTAADRLGAIQLGRLR